MWKIHRHTDSDYNLIINRIYTFMELKDFFNVTKNVKMHNFQKNMNYSRM